MVFDKGLDQIKFHGKVLYFSALGITGRVWRKTSTAFTP